MMKPRTPVKRISDKQRERRGGGFLSSTIVKKPGKVSSGKPYIRGGNQKPRKPIPKVNVERQKKATARSRKKHAAYMKSQTRKDVEARSGGRCERVIRISAAVHLEMTGNHWPLTFRCDQPATEHHHLSYARYGGDELPEDIQHCCGHCHRVLESLKPAGNRRSRSSYAAHLRGD